MTEKSDKKLKSKATRKGEDDDHDEEDDENKRAGDSSIQ